MEKSQRNHLVWDCGSTLYDSFELNAFNLQLNSAIHSRTMSMPHLRHTDPPASKKLPQSSKLSRSVQKLLKSMFKFRQTCSSSSVLLPRHRSNEEHYVVYDKTGAPNEGFVPEIINQFLVRRTAFERSAAASAVGISCA